LLSFSLIVSPPAPASGCAILPSVEIKDKLVVVTGAARGVGRGIARELARAGARPVVHYCSSADAARALAAELGSVALQADLGERDGARRLVDAALAQGGDLAAWVSSAALLERRAFLESDDELWQRTLELGLLAPARCARLIAPHLRARGGGAIVNVLDLGAQQPWRGYAHHCATKAALAMLTRSLALELAPEVRVCGVTPGLISAPADPAWAHLEQRIPLARRGAPEEVGRAVRFLLEADYLTGSVLTVDGGLAARGLDG
jgi:pteridine reductase